MNALGVVFPKACNVLCRFHVAKNVKAKCKMIIHSKDAWNQMMEAWGSVVDCDDVEQFENRVQAFELFVLHGPYLLIMLMVLG